MKNLALGAFALVVALSAGSASASTFNFTSGGSPFTVDGVTLTLTGQRDCFGWGGANVSYSANGVGVAATSGCLPGLDSSALDGQADERLNFSFSEQVTLIGMTMSEFDDDDPYQVFVDFGGGFVSLGTANTPTYSFALGTFTDSLRILVTANDSAFRVQSLEFAVAAVPLPATGLLLLGGLGGLAVLRRKRKAA